MDCYILIGGRSRRMGNAKATVELGGTTFLERAVRAASGAFDRIVLVDRREGSGPRVDGIRTIVEDAHTDEAAIFGVARALRDAAGRCFVLALDYPLITAELLRELRDCFEASAAPMLVPVHRGVPQTLCAGYAPAMREMIEARIAAAKYDLRALTAVAELVPVEGDEWINVNTPEELEEARRRHDHEGFLPSR